MPTRVCSLIASHLGPGACAQVSFRTRRVDASKNRYDVPVTNSIIEAMAEQHIPLTAVLDDLCVSRAALNDPCNRSRVIAHLEGKCPDWRHVGALELAFPPTFTPEVPPSNS